ncbi:MAG: Unknown protein [uncultured Thiotrichaceae bacterium]|uniref:SGNH domain-containing protein n=1 Tax=uncultured Thiotrichaceae bacterium TaxID=298394 RepID=A0A6S6SHL1_9GAMM|nr:MAG: Unknown protein [uncultured Thiotrichaceae bacterium]
MKISKGVMGIFLMLLISGVSADNHNIKTVRADLLKASNLDEGGAYVRKRFLGLLKKPFDKKDSRKKLLLIGDSHAQDFLNAVMENNYLSHYQIRTRYIPTLCQMVLSNENTSKFIDRKHHKLCNESDDLAQMRGQIAEADSIILSANWRQWSAERLPQTIKNLKLRSDQKLVVIGRKSFGRIKARKYLRMSLEDLKAVVNKVDGHQERINRLMKKTVSPKHFVDIQKRVCGYADKCPIMTPSMRLLSFDGGHFTQAGAKFAGQRLFIVEPLKTL